MNKPWSIQRQVRFWKLCGWKLQGLDIWIGPDNRLSDGLPDLDMNNLYAYAVKKLQKTHAILLSWREGHWFALVTPYGKEAETTDGPDPVMALAVACEKALKALEKDSTPKSK